MHPEDLTNVRFGRWVAIKLAEPLTNIKYKRPHWLCKCDCGNIGIVQAHSLKKGTSTSCGCKRNDNTRGLNLLPDKIASMNTVYSHYKIRAKQKNIPFNLSKEDFFEITSKKCFYCGKIPSNSYRTYKYNGNYVYNGIDRIDSSKGYEEGNIVPCCKMCNSAKSNYTKEEFFLWIEMVYKCSIMSS